MSTTQATWTREKRCDQRDPGECRGRSEGVPDALIVHKAGGQAHLHGESLEGCYGVANLVDELQVVRSATSTETPRVIRCEKLESTYSILAGDVTEDLRQPDTQSRLDDGGGDGDAPNSTK